MSGVGVLASGSGTNLQALLDRPGIDVVAVGSDKPSARALERARAAGVPCGVFPRESFEDRAARDVAMASWLAGRGASIVVLAGYMQLVTPEFLGRFPDRVVNVHPALLPAFPGLRAIQQALDYGVRVAGVTVHLVDEGVDSGPILLQRAVDVPPGVDADGLHDLLRPHEHDLLCRGVELLAAGAVSRDPSHPRRMLVDAARAIPVALDHVQVAAPPESEDAARGFYGDVLGLPETTKPPELAPRGGVWFRCGAQEIHVGIEGGGFAPSRKAHPAFRLVDGAALRAAVDRVTAAGGQVDWTETSEPPTSRVYTHDPFGNRIELTAPRDG